MAVVDTLPPVEVIQSHKGVLDFYVYRGLVCVRQWPRRPAQPRSPAVQAAGAAFAQLSQALNLTAPEVIAQATEAASPQPWTWKDVLTSAAYAHFNLPR